MQKIGIPFLSMFFMFFMFWGYAQVKMSYLQDTKNEFSINTIKTEAFKPLKAPLNKGLNNGTYWLKVENIDQKSVVQFPNNHISTGKAYVNNSVVFPEKNHRFLTFIVEQSPIYIKLNITKEAYIPITIKAYKPSQYEAKKENIYIGFYYGFAFLIFLLNLIYFVNFKEDTFLYYALFLGAISLGLLISDGILNFFGVSASTIEVIEVVTHILVAILSALFATSYLQIEDYYPKLKYVTIAITLVMTAFGIVYLVTNTFTYYVIMELLVFTMFTVYWFTGFSLFKNNVFTKIFTVAYIFILIFGIGYYVTKLFGVNLIIEAPQLKMTGFFEMILLSFAVVYRMRILHQGNQNMRREITQYAMQIASLSEELEKNKQGQPNYFSHFNLTTREQYIFTLLTQGKSNKQISKTVSISINTVKYHIKNIYSKLDIKSRKEAKKIARLP